MSQSKITLGVIGLCFSFVVVLGLFYYGPWSAHGIARSADRQLLAVGKIYAKGNFDEITNAIGDYVSFVKSHRNKISRERYVDMLLSSAYMRLATVSIYHGFENAACDYLMCAFEYHTAQRAVSKIAPVPKTEFVEFVMAGVEAIDAKSQIVWRTNVTLNPTSVIRIKACFENKN